MKSIALLVLFNLFFFAAFSQDLNKLLGLFEKANLPYEFPAEASVGFGDEEESEQSPYKAIDVELFNSITGAGVYEQDELEAVAKLEFPNFYLLVVAETSMNINNGMVHRSLVYYTLNKKGQMIDMRYAQKTTMHDSFDAFETMDTDASMAMSEYDGEENTIIVEKTKKVYRSGTEGTHNESETVVSITYDSIDANGKIADVTTYLKK